MRIAYLDCNAGMSGNMFLGALLDGGLPLDWLENELRRLPFEYPGLRITQAVKKGISATHFEVMTEDHHHGVTPENSMLDHPHHPHRGLHAIIQMIHTAGYDPEVIDTACRCFTYLAEAEAKIHGVTPDEVHFHEVGAVDAIIDIVGAALGVHYLRLEKIGVSPVRMGFGRVNCAHGEIPLPAPAALELMKDFPIFGGDQEGEWTTPTGAAIIKTLATYKGALPAMKVTKIGYGAGTAERAIPNVLRLMIGETDALSDSQEQQMIIETNIDDMNPEIYGYLGGLFLENGAKDYYFTPVQMKKGRPGVLVTVVAPPETASAIEDLLLTETTTLGIRKYTATRRCLERQSVELRLPEGTVRVKVALQDGQIFKMAPEYEDCRRIALETGRPMRDIYETAVYEARKKWKIKDAGNLR